MQLRKNAVSRCSAGPSIGLQPRVLIRDFSDRDAISSHLMRNRDQNGQDWADIIDFLTMYPEARRRVVRTLAEIDASTV